MLNHASGKNFIYFKWGDRILALLNIQKFAKTSILESQCYSSNPTQRRQIQLNIKAK